MQKAMWNLDFSALSFETAVAAFLGSESHMSVSGVVQYLATAAWEDHLMIPKSKSFLVNLLAGRLLRIVSRYPIRNDPN